MTRSVGQHFAPIDVTCFFFTTSSLKRTSLSVGLKPMDAFSSEICGQSGKITSGKRPFLTAKTMNFPFYFLFKLHAAQTGRQPRRTQHQRNHRKRQDHTLILAQTRHKGFRAGKFSTWTTSLPCIFWRETTARSGRKG